MQITGHLRGTFSNEFRYQIFEFTRSNKVINKCNVILPVKRQGVKLDNTLNLPPTSSSQDIA